MPSQTNHREHTYATHIIPAPVLDYRPARASDYRPSIGLVGCGRIAATHLQAYANAGYNVAALADHTRAKAEQLRDKFFPKAVVYDQAGQLMDDVSLDIVDITTHPRDREELIPAAIRAGQNVLSQKPFVTDLELGRHMADLADQHGVKLAVNQNGRWAPHVRYARQAIKAGLLGSITSVDVAVYWDHNWCAGTTFENIQHLVLFDFGIHWFDMLCCFLGDASAQEVFASIARTRTQRPLPPLNAQVLVKFPAAQASLVFRGDTTRGPRERTVIIGSRATLVCEGPDLNHQQISIYTDDGVMRPELEGRWFNDGFDGAISELIVAIEENREPYHSARNNLKSLELCFAAVASADSGEPVRVGSAKRLSPQTTG
jgi:predicted dehydrogenase